MTSEDPKSIAQVVWTNFVVNQFVIAMNLFTVNYEQILYYRNYMIVGK